MQATVELRNIAATEAVLGRVAGHTVVVDRPEGKAGGQDLGFNAVQLLAPAIGGCYYNDLRYTAHDLGVAIGEIEVSVTLDLEGTPLISTNAVLSVGCTTLDWSDPDVLINGSWSISMLGNSLNRGIPTSIARR